MKTRVNLTLSDRYTYELRSKEYCDETFGEDYMQEYGLNLPSDLVTRYFECMKVFDSIQKELREIYKKGPKE